MSKILFSMLLGLSMFLPTPLKAEGDVTANLIVQQVEACLSPPNVQAQYTFMNYRLDGTSVNYQVRFTIADATHAYGYFEKPAREKGREVLRLEDVLWTYLPSVGRAVRIADQDSFAGGDFSNADVLRIDWSNQYHSRLLKETDKQWIIEMNAASDSAAYNKIWMWVDKKTTQPVQQIFYDANGTALKRCRFGSVTDFGMVTRPARIVMENLITTQKSEMTVLSVRTLKHIPQSRFAVDQLGK